MTIYRTVVTIYRTVTLNLHSVMLVTMVRYLVVLLWTSNALGYKIRQTNIFSEME